MAQGFVYVMVNPAHREFVKIGGTERDPETRAAELSTTGVPFDFVVVHAERVTNWEAVEAILHDRFANDRAAPNREFFRVSARVAIAAAIDVAATYLPAPVPEHEASPADARPGYPPPYGRSRVRHERSERDPSFQTVQMAVVTCTACSIDFSTALLRYETQVRCPQCHLLQPAGVRWD